MFGAENGYWRVLQIQFQTKTLVSTFFPILFAFVVVVVVVVLSLSLSLSLSHTHTHLLFVSYDFCVVGFILGLLESFDSCIWNLFLISWCEEVLSPFVFKKWVRDHEVPIPICQKMILVHSGFIFSSCHIWFFFPCCTPRNVCAFSSAASKSTQ